ncbi:hypothetical protein [Sphingobium sp. HWE2-09]|uniref:hypothetical protein n=1 Tax=Sphingobium sp. HWE2-09 TaxID=3108390 RepID=UPI002DCE0F09|nr:hypothetical protein [Sphingobium sp. HWE2-09]
MTGSVSGRPFRFFAMLMLGWVALRLVAQQPFPPSTSHAVAERQLEVAALAPQVLMGSSAMTILPPLPQIAAPAATVMTKHVVASNRLAPRATSSTSQPEVTPINLMAFVTESAEFASRPHAGDPDAIQEIAAPTAGPSPLMTTQSVSDRWRAASWLLWRPGAMSGGQAVPTGQLGGSQVGARIDYALTSGAPNAATAYARMSSALQRPAALEGAVGLSIRPLDAVPIRLAVERRIAIGQAARNANAFMAVGGFGPVAIAPAIMAEAYAQTGIVGFRQRDGFIDGKFSLATPIAQSPLRVGAALSGGAQPGVSRLDIGPEIQVRLPLPQGGARLSVEWRERVAGDALPGSGLAITLAADF